MLDQYLPAKLILDHVVWWGVLLQLWSFFYQSMSTLIIPAYNKKSVGEMMQTGLGHWWDPGAGCLHLPPNSLDFGFVLRFHLHRSLHVMKCYMNFDVLVSLEFGHIVHPRLPRLSKTPKIAKRSPRLLRLWNTWSEFWNLRRLKCLDPWESL